jgi:transposase-like protein
VRCFVCQKITKMTATEFDKLFPDEIACRDYWRSIREKAGITCSKCKSKEHYWHHWNQEWRCKRCKKTTTLRTGTVMMHSNLPIRTWFRAIFEVMSRKKSISSTELYRQFPEIKSEGTAWYLLHRLRIAMGARDAQYQLHGDVEVDEAFITVVKEIEPETRRDKRGRGAVRKSPVLVLASTISRSDKKVKKSKKSSLPLYFKMIQLPNLTSTSLNEGIFRNVKAKTHIFTDKFRSYNDIKHFVDKHTATKTPPKQAHETLPWVHCAIGNFKRIIDGIFHHVNDEYLQNYLDEYIFKLNRRRSKEPFFRLLNACIYVPWG